MAYRSKVTLIPVLLALPALAQVQHLPLEPQHDSGQSVTGAFEGWFKNPDGTFSILLGYFNRNAKEELDVPIGPDNRIEPGGPDRGQPTHFLTRRRWGVFTVTVPGSFGSARLTWTLVANGASTVIPASLDPLWEVSPFKEEGMGNTPPVVSIGTASSQGPLSKTLAAFTATVGTPFALEVGAEDDAKTFPGAKPPRTPPVVLTWSKFRGPGQVIFSSARPPVENKKSSTTVTFSEPGDYILHVVANDWSGDGGRGFQCCWTTAQVRVSVTQASPPKGL